MIRRIKNSLRFRIRYAAQVVVEHLIEAFNLDSRALYYASIGILKYRGDESGEKWFLNNKLSSLLRDIDSPVMLDVGANIGRYSIDLADAYPKAKVYSLEPSPQTYTKLVENARLYAGIKPINCGAGSKAEVVEIFSYANYFTAGLASLYRNVITDLHRQNDVNVVSVVCDIDTIDSLVETNAIPEPVIHFIKIDTEGHELEGLKGAIETINRRGVIAIQFEFNEMNVIS